MNSQEKNSSANGENQMSVFERLYNHAINLEAVCSKAAKELSNPIGIHSPSNVSQAESIVAQIFKDTEEINNEILKALTEVENELKETESCNQEYSNYIQTVNKELDNIEDELVQYGYIKFEALQPSPQNFLRDSFQSVLNTSRLVSALSLESPGLKVKELLESSASPLNSNMVTPRSNANCFLENYVENLNTPMAWLVKNQKTIRKSLSMSKISSKSVPDLKIVNTDTQKLDKDRKSRVALNDRFEQSLNTPGLNIKDISCSSSILGSNKRILKTPTRPVLKSEQFNKSRALSKEVLDGSLINSEVVGSTVIPRSNATGEKTVIPTPPRPISKFQISRQEK